MRRGKLRYRCQSCEGWFSLNRTKKNKTSLHLHLKGLSYRDLSSESGVSLGKSWYSVQEKIEKLPHCFDITRKYCSGYTGILLVDGKYLRVMPYERKIPVLYGVDYLSHDIPGYRLVPSESYTACLKF